MNEVINFLIIAFLVFVVVKQANRLKSPPPAVPAPATRECPLCLSAVPVRARRCAFCCGDLPAAG